jgi:aminoglycoside phosphotransferase family enzyme/predicted kinase
MLSSQAANFRPQEAASQRELVAALTEGRVKGIPGPTTRIDTHLSHVFLSADLAFKLKRAVRLPFVDFEELEARRTACEAELTANQPLAGPLYVAVKSVTRTADGNFSFDGDGQIVDWLVVMRRFEQGDQFDRLALAGKLTIGNVESAVDILIRSHEVAPANRQRGYAADYQQVIDELRQTEAGGSQCLGLNDNSPILFARLAAELTRVSNTIEQRREYGMVKRGHGDLHLRNICLFNGNPTPFDALEFNEELATTDVIYDLAFLLMDLRRLGLLAHANAAMNRYWDGAGESESALVLVPFFMSLRAAVRMAVAIVAGELGEAHAYRSLGLELLKGERPVVVAIGGLSGTGKSTVAKSIASQLPGPAGARLLRTDVLRKSKHSLNGETGERIYSSERRGKVYEELERRVSVSTMAGASVVADATFSEGKTRDGIARAATGAAFYAFWLTAPLSVRLVRVSRRVGDVSDADVKVAASQQEPQHLPSTWRFVNADRPLESICADILAGLARGRLDAQTS